MADETNGSSHNPAGAPQANERRTLPRVLSTPTVVAEPIFNVAPEPEPPAPKPRANVEKRLVLMERPAPKRDKPRTLSDLKI